MVRQAPACVAGQVVDPETVAQGLRGLEAPLGVVAVLGNHDWWLDGLRVRKALETAGVRVLENEVAEVRRGGASLWLAGMADLMTRTPQVERTVAKAPPGAAVIVLTHNPDVFPEVPATVLLTLAGHTHGGQVNLPFFGRMVVPSRFGGRFAAGHVVEDGRQLYVTTGIGTSILPVRFRVAPEVVVLTLEPGEGPALSSPSPGR